MYKATIRKHRPPKISRTTEKLIEQWKHTKPSSDIHSKLLLLKSCIKSAENQKSLEILTTLEEILVNVCDHYLSPNNIISLKYDFQLEALEKLASERHHIFAEYISRIYIKLYWFFHKAFDKAKEYLKKANQYVGITENPAIVCEFFLCMCDLISEDLLIGKGLEYVRKAQNAMESVLKDEKIPMSEIYRLNGMISYYDGVFESDLDLQKSIASFEHSITQLQMVQDSKTLLMQAEKKLKSAKDKALSFSELQDVMSSSSFRSTNPATQRNATKISKNSINHEFSLMIKPRTDIAAPKIKPSSATVRAKPISVKSPKAQSYRNSATGTFEFTTRHSMKNFNFALIKTSEIIDSGIAYVCKFSISPDLNMIFVHMKNKNKQVFTKEFPVAEDEVVLETINNKIEPLLHIINGQICVVDRFEKVFARVLKVIQGEKSWMTIYKSYPRENFRIREIFKENTEVDRKIMNYKNFNVEISQLTTTYLISSIFLRPDDCILIPYQQHNLIYAKKQVISTYSLLLKIYHIIFPDFQAFLIEPESEDKLGALFIDEHSCDLDFSNLQSTADFIISNLSIENSNVQLNIAAKIHRSQSVISIEIEIPQTEPVYTKVLNNTIYNFEFNFLEDSIEIISKQTDQELYVVVRTPQCSEGLNLIDTILSRIVLISDELAFMQMPNYILEFFQPRLEGLSRRKSAEVDSETILYRTSIIRNKTLYQIFMTKHKLPIIGIVFILHINSGKDFSRNLQVDLSMVTAKTGFTEKCVKFIGNYLAKYLLVINPQGICYFDFDIPIYNAVNMITKLQALFRGRMVRKIMKWRRSILIYKRNCVIEKIKYKVLLYENEKNLILKLVRNDEVLSAELSLKTINHAGYYDKLELFINDILVKKIKILESNCKRVIGGLEKYLAVKA